MGRKEDIASFYSILDSLEEINHGKRVLAQCTGKDRWPKRGVYFFFEPGEVRENAKPKVTRVGTHALPARSKTTLWKRLRQHRGTTKGRHPGGGDHRGSIFRLHVGTAIISRDGLECPTWDKRNTAKGPIKDAEYPIEKMVSKHIGAMPFLWLAINDEPGPDSLRGVIERNSIGLLSNWVKQRRSTQRHVNG